jgi:hypothetical protein
LVKLFLKAYNKDMKSCFKRTIDYEYDDENPTQTTSYCIENECNPLIGNWDFGEYIGEGNYGVVYNVKIKGENYVAKAIPLDVIIPSEDCNIINRHLGDDCFTVERNDFELEAKISRKAGEIGVGPKIAGAFICDETFSITTDKDREYSNDQIKISMGVIVMKKLDMTLEEYARSYSKAFDNNLDRIYDLVYENANKLGKIGYSLADMHPGNIMVNIDRYRDVEGLFFIDFGDAYEIENEEQNNTFANFQDKMSSYFD